MYRILNRATVVSEGFRDGVCELFEIFFRLPLFIMPYFMTHPSSPPPNPSTLPKMGSQRQESGFVETDLLASGSERVCVCVSVVEKVYFFVRVLLHSPGSQLTDGKSDTPSHPFLEQRVSLHSALQNFRTRYLCDRAKAKFHARVHTTPAPNMITREPGTTRIFICTRSPACT